MGKRGKEMLKRQKVIRGQMFKRKMTKTSKDNPLRETYLLWVCFKKLNYNCNIFWKPQNNNYFCSIVKNTFSWNREEGNPCVTEFSCWKIEIVRKVE